VVQPVAGVLYSGLVLSILQRMIWRSPLVKKQLRRLKHWEIR
jgi:hypothetical protein